MLTERGVPIAAIRPVAPKDDSIEERLNALEDRGVLKRRTGQLKLPTPVALPGKAVSSLIIDERTEGL